jgi:hypothetical protein
MRRCLVVQTSRQIVRQKRFQRRIEIVSPDLGQRGLSPKIGRKPFPRIPRKAIIRQIGPGIAFRPAQKPVFVQGRRSTPSAATPSAKARAESSLRGVGSGASDRTSAPSRFTDRARTDAVAASNAASCLASIRSANRCSISSREIAAASLIRAEPAAPAMSATAR